MLSLYYRIWMDVIARQQSKKVQNSYWQLYALVPMSTLMGLNLFTFFYWMKMVVSRYLPLLFPVNIFAAKPLNGFVSVVITFFLPFVILNYLLVFNNNRYEDLQKKYKGENGKLFNKYALITVGILIIPMAIQKMFF